MTPHISSESMDRNRLDKWILLRNERGERTWEL